MKKIKLLTLLFLFFFTGCWNYHELNELAIATGLAIDKDDEKYEVSILIANSKKSQVSSKEGESSTTVLSGTGKTLSEAFKDIELKSPRKIYIGHLAIIVVHEDVAKEGLIDISDVILRNPESVKRFYLVIAKDDKAKSIIKILTPLESFPSQSIYYNLKVSNEYQASSTSVTYSKFIENVLTKGINPILPTISVNGSVKDGSKSSNLEKSEPDAEVKLGTIAIFKDDKLIGYTSKNESRGINIIKSEVNEVNITSTCPNDKENFFITKLSNLKSNIKLSIKDNKPNITVNVESNGEFTEVNCDINLKDPNNIKKLEDLTEKQVKKLMNDALEVSQKKYKSDIFGFGNLVYKKNPTLYKNINNWDDYFSNLDIKTKVKLNIESKGSLERSLKEATNEK